MCESICPKCESIRFPSESIQKVLCKQVLKGESIRSQSESVRPETTLQIPLCELIRSRPESIRPVRGALFGRFLNLQNTQIATQPPFCGF